MADEHPDDVNEHFKLTDLQWVKKFKLPIIFVFGGPGAGKASMCFRFRLHYGATYFSLGQLLRDEAREPTKRGREIARYVHQLPNRKVPVELVMHCLKDMLIKTVAAKRPIFIQGFPKDFEQAVLYEKEIAPIRHAMYINTSEKTTIRRLTDRNKHASRFEDQEAVIRARREGFRRDTFPVVENLANECRIFEIDGNGNMRNTFAQAQELYEAWMVPIKEELHQEGLRQCDRISANFRKDNVTRKISDKETEAEKTFPSVHYIGPIKEPPSPAKCL